MFWLEKILVTNFVEKRSWPLTGRSNDNRKTIGTIMPLYVTCFLVQKIDFMFLGSIKNIDTNWKVVQTEPDYKHYQFASGQR